jgi:hypothetical protein
MWKAFCLVSLGINIVFLTWLAAKNILSDPELANKQEWSILEFLESQNKNVAVDTRIIYKKNIDNLGYDAVGIYDVATARRIWILGNSKNIPMIKILPSVNRLEISEEEVAKIVGEISMNADTRQFLSVQRN